MLPRPPCHPDTEPVTSAMVLAQLLDEDPGRPVGETGRLLAVCAAGQALRLKPGSVRSESGPPEARKGLLPQPGDNWAWADAWLEGIPASATWQGILAPSHKPHRDDRSACRRQWLGLDALRLLLWWRWRSDRQDLPCLRQALARRVRTILAAPRHWRLLHEDMRHLVSATRPNLFRLEPLLAMTMDVPFHIIRTTSRNDLVPQSQRHGAPGDSSRAS